MPDDVIVFDFDGTCTVPDPKSEGAFLLAHQQGLATLTGKSNNWMMQGYAQARLEIQSNPNEYGWVIGGDIVAPALVDAYVEAQVCAQIILRDLGEDAETWASRLDELYQTHYLKYETVFRDELLETLRMLRDRETPFYIVTNSDPKKVQHRLALLGADAEWISPQVRGNAKKYVISRELEPLWVNFPDLRRNIDLRKQHYSDVLTAIIKQHEASWDKLHVIGDIAELDLALPVTMGAHGYLILNKNTPLYEQDWVKSQPRARCINRLSDPWSG